jgi:carbon storage regulator
MLILTRNKLQEIVIGENAEIRVTVLSIDGNQVKLGFTAEKNIPINRVEIFQKIQQEKEALLNEYA